MNEEFTIDWTFLVAVVDLAIENESGNHTALTKSNNGLN
jgi:hypothetical protein